MKRKTLRWVLLVGTLVWAFASAAPTPTLRIQNLAAAGEGALRATLYTTVEGNLSPQDFQVEAGGEALEAQAVRSYGRAEGCATSYLLLVDIPSVMTQRSFTAMQEALASFVEQLGPQDNVGLLLTGEAPSAGTLRDSGSQVATEIREMSKKTTASTLNASILDAVTFLETSNTVKERKVLLVASTGAKRDETGATQAEVQEGARKESLTIYTLAMMSTDKEKSKTQQANDFGTIARQSLGGLDIVAVENQVKADDILDQLVKNESRFYSLQFAPPQGGQADTVSISIKDQDRLLTDQAPLSAELLGAVATATPAPTEEVAVGDVEGAVSTPSVEPLPEPEPGMPTEILLLIGAGALLVILLVVLLVVTLKKKKAPSVEEKEETEPAVDEGMPETEVIPSAGGAEKTYVTFTPIGKSAMKPTSMYLADSLVIGRNSATSQLVIPEDPKVSGKHALLSYGGGVMRIEDLQSTNGTRVNDVDVTAPVAVNQNDIITIGRTSLRIQWRER